MSVLTNPFPTFPVRAASSYSRPFLLKRGADGTCPTEIMSILIKAAGRGYLVGALKAATTAILTEVALIRQVRWPQWEGN